MTPIKLTIVTILILYLSSCTLGVNDADGRTSMNIKESKLNKYFLCEYSVIQKPQKFFEIDEAWLEKGWGYEIINLFKYKKTARDYCQIGIKVNDTFHSRYDINDFSKYLLKYEENNRYVGNDFGVNSVSLDECYIRDTISLSLLEVDSLYKKTEIGKILLIRKR